MTKSSLSCASLVGIAILAAGGMAGASAERVLYSFPPNSRVFGQLQEDSSGNLYGTAFSDYRKGSVYRLTEHRGGWRIKAIHVFTRGSDGKAPFAGLTPARGSGIFYGTTTEGGAYDIGTIFKLVQSGRKWTETVLHSFTGSDGESPNALMTRDKATGVLYGTAYAGESASCGVVFRLDPTTSQFGVLYNFQGGNDGCDPETQLREGPEPGTLIGGTVRGGTADAGTLFLLSEKNGVWSESVIHNFTGGADGSYPFDLTVPADDADQSMFGVARDGGANGKGVVFQLKKPRGKWVYKVIYAFTGSGDGANPAGLHLDRASGLLYGTATYGGAHDRGVVFKLTNSGAQWTETVLHNFGGMNGRWPWSRPLLDPRTGILYGTTPFGRHFNGGTVYAVTP